MRRPFSLRLQRYRVPTGRLCVVLYAHFMLKMCRPVIESSYESVLEVRTRFPCSRWIHIEGGGQNGLKLIKSDRFDADLRREGLWRTSKSANFDIGGTYAPEGNLKGTGVCKIEHFGMGRYLKSTKFRLRRRWPSPVGSSLEGLGYS